MPHIVLFVHGIELDILARNTVTKILQRSCYLRNRKRVACVYGVIMNAGNVKRIREKRLKHEAWPSVLHVCSLLSNKLTFLSGRRKK